MGVVDKQINICGEVCPYTYVKSKLALEGLEKGQILEITLNHKPAVKNVPRSMENEGHRVIETAQVSETEWKIVVEKG